VNVPTPGKGQALLQVLGSSVNPVDCDLVEAGIKFGTLGMDGSGKVVSVGEGCDLEVGDEVFGNFNGAYAEYSLAGCSGLAKLGSFSHAEAGTLPIIAGTSIQCLAALDLPNLAKTDNNLTVVVTSGQGGTGHMGVQIAKAMGAKRVVTACAGEGIELCKSIGADVVVDYHEQDLFDALPDDSVDLVFDNFGSPGTADKAMHAIRPGGTFLVLMGGEGGKISDHPKEGVKQIPFGLQTSGRSEMELVASYIDAGLVKPHIFASYGIHEVREAWAALRGHGVLGKISIDPSNTTGAVLV
jgi:NADPH:quinone reductase-like Zn-dependent oxidoreductase